MNHNVITKSIATDDDMKKISSFARREMNRDEIYTFNVTLCTNEVDRDGEKFTVEALNELAPMFVGKTGISDHSMKSSDQRARIFETSVERDDTEKTADGEPLYRLNAKAYMLSNEQNQVLIDEIDAGIKKEVSVSCSMKNTVCSVCGADRRNGGCSHIKGKSYDDNMCFDILSGPTDAYEFSFVAVPAQRRAGVQKSFCFTDTAESGDIVKAIGTCDSDITITKSQAKKLSSYIDRLKEEAVLGENYKNELAKEVVSLFSKAFPQVDKRLFSSVAAVMTSKELLGIRDGMKGSAEKKAVPQLTQNKKTIQNDYSEFRI